MLKQLILENWKSFRHAVLHIDPLTVLLGTNASGKTNAIEALKFLRRISMGETFQQALSSIRGDFELAAFQSETQFSMRVIVQGEDENTDYWYSISVETGPKAQLLMESLVQIQADPLHENQKKETEIFRPRTLDGSLIVDLPLVVDESYQEPSQGLMGYVVDRSHSILSKLGYQAIPQMPLTLKPLPSIEAVLKTLQNIFILDVLPSKIRSYSPVSAELLSDASNIAGVLAALPDEDQANVEKILSDYVVHLPEKEIRRVWAETVGRLNRDAMLYCEETWIPDSSPMIMDARGMSDGTLRVIAIVTALLTRPEGSQLVIEEVDSGLHPSRADLLLKILKEIGEKRQIDVLVTTHNPALLNALDPEMIPFIAVAHRNNQTGESNLTLLEDLENLPQLLALGPLGKLAAQGAIEKSLAGSK